MMGTAKYLSPEQVLGFPLDGRADLYSLGLVLYECLTGAGPFTGATDGAIAIARLQRDPTPIRRSGPRSRRPSPMPSPCLCPPARGPPAHRGRGSGAAGPGGERAHDATLPPLPLPRPMGRPRPRRRHQPRTTPRSRARSVDGRGRAHRHGGRRAALGRRRRWPVAYRDDGNAAAARPPGPTSCGRGAGGLGAGHPRPLGAAGPGRSPSRPSRSSTPRRATGGEPGLRSTLTDGDPTTAWTTVLRVPLPLSQEMGSAWSSACPVRSPAQQLRGRVARRPVAGVDLHGDRTGAAREDWGDPVAQRGSDEPGHDLLPRRLGRSVRLAVADSAGPVRRCSDQPVPGGVGELAVEPAGLTMDADLGGSTDGQLVAAAQRATGTRWTNCCAGTST